jgi:hypothetical protein
VPALEPEQSRGPDDEADAAESAEDHDRMRECVGRRRLERVVIERGERRRGEAEQEAVDGEVMERAAQSLGRVIEACADVTTLSSAFQVLERERVYKRRSVPIVLVGGTRDLSPVDCFAETPRAEGHREDRVEKGDTKHSDHQPMREDSIERSGARAGEAAAGGAREDEEKREAGGERERDDGAVAAVGGAEGRGARRSPRSSAGESARRLRHVTANSCGGAYWQA